jgi:hypothetical protein
MMGYIPDLDTDVFISYAHKNNAEGWVDGLDDYLSNRVPQLLEHEAKVTIWRDRSLSGFDLLWPTLQERIRTSALFLSVCSPVYVTSENCEKEVTYFLNTCIETPRIDRKARMARVVIIPYANLESARPSFKQDDTVRYHFYEDRNDGTFNQFMVDSHEFRAPADRLAQHIASQLRRMRAEVGKVEARDMGTKQRKLFVANCSKDRTTDRTTVVNEFKQFELLTIPDGAYTTAEIEEQTKQLLAQAECSIHILGERPGIRPEDSSEPIVQLQYRLALTHRPENFTQVVWAPTTLQLTDARQKEFVESVRSFNAQDFPKGTEVLCGSLDDLLRGVQGVLDRARATTRLEGTGPLYVLCAKSDIENEQEDVNLSKLRDFLCGQGVLPEFPAFDDEDADLAEVEKNSIAQSCATLIYYGRGGDGWVKRKRQTLIQVLGELKAQGQHVRALYISEPANALKRAQYLGMKVREFEEARGYPPLLVLGTAQGFENEHLAPLLARLSGGGRP